MRVEEVLLEYGCDDAVYLTEECYDEALAGITCDGRAVYDYEAMVECLMKCDGITYEEAADYIDFNVIRSLPYMGEKAPVIMYQVY